MSEEDIKKWLDSKPQGVVSLVVLMSFSDGFCSKVDATVKDVARMLLSFGVRDKDFADAVIVAGHVLQEGGEE